MPRLLVVLAPLALCSCPPPLFETGNCGDDGELAVVIYHRSKPEVVENGSEVPVFPPPQGGVFTELDATIEGVPVTDIGQLEFEIRSLQDQVLAFESYDLEAIPLACQEDETIRVDNVPVGFELDTILQDLEGVEATLTCSLETAVGTTSVTYDVVLRVTGY